MSNTKLLWYCDRCGSSAWRSEGTPIAQSLVCPQCAELDVDGGGNLVRVDVNPMRPARLTYDDGEGAASRRYHCIECEVEDALVSSAPSFDDALDRALAALEIPGEDV